jgi:hypothetical protein
MTPIEQAGDVGGEARTVVPAATVSFAIRVMCNEKAGAGLHAADWFIGKCANAGRRFDDAVCRHTEHKIESILY